MDEEVGLVALVMIYPSNFHFTVYDVQVHAFSEFSVSRETYTYPIVLNCPRAREESNN